MAVFISPRWKKKSLGKTKVERIKEEKHFNLQQEKDSSHENIPEQEVCE